MASAAIVATQAWQVLHDPERTLLAELAQLCVSFSDFGEVVHQPGLTVCQATKQTFLLRNNSPFHYCIVQGHLTEQQLLLLSL